MASTPSFEWVSQELERITSLERLEARGTLRLVLKKAGLDASGVTVRQMEVVIRELLPKILERRGVRCATAASGAAVAPISSTKTR